MYYYLKHNLLWGPFSKKQDAENAAGGYQVFKVANHDLIGRKVTCNLISGIQVKGKISRLHENFNMYDIYIEDGPPSHKGKTLAFFHKEIIF